MNTKRPTPRHMVKYPKEYLKSSRRKAGSYIQGSAQKTVSWFLKNFADTKGLAQNIQSDEKQWPTMKITPRFLNPWATDQYWNQATQQDEGGEQAGKAYGITAWVCLLSVSPHPPGLWKNCLSRKQSLVLKRLGTTALPFKTITYNPRRDEELPIQ